ncbi:suppressor of fused domain protein [Kribbella sp. NPDC056345]|uniref:suppressor of fused domain protein n=1 Tax=Kribbella sp. NPDC056345 TaxID=3345789 RepID=UPI0035DB6AE4
MMTKAEYLARAEAEDDWAPGWLAIDAAFGARYPAITPPHLAAPVQERAIFGGEEYIDGFSIYPSPSGYQHLLTYGMSKLYVDEESFGGAFSGWGYEMTMKIRANGPDGCHWAVNSLRNLARYTYTSELWFEPFQFISGRGEPLRTESDTLLTSYVMAPDTEVPGIDTVHGRVDFIQLVGITQPELDWVAGESVEGAAERAKDLLRRIADDGNPHLVTDLSRSHSYV